MHFVCQCFETVSLSPPPPVFFVPAAIVGIAIFALTIVGLAAFGWVYYRKVYRYRRNSYEPI
eukprot:m.263953 g.263953  ORF g.263953 m.263953 type:complete len:62 (-) comp22767_c4_seq1:30-215(-)